MTYRGVGRFGGYILPRKYEYTKIICHCTKQQSVYLCSVHIMKGYIVIYDGVIFKSKFSIVIFYNVNCF